MRIKNFPLMFVVTLSHIPHNIFCIFMYMFSLFKIKTIVDAIAAKDTSRKDLDGSLPVSGIIVFPGHVFQDTRKVSSFFSRWFHIKFNFFNSFPIKLFCMFSDKIQLHVFCLSVLLLMRLDVFQCWWRAQWLMLLDGWQTNLGEEWR